MDQAGLSATGYAGNAEHNAEWYFGRDVFQVMKIRVGQRENLLLINGAPPCLLRDRGLFWIRCTIRTH